MFNRCKILQSRVWIANVYFYSVILDLTCVRLRLTLSIHLNILIELKIKLSIATWILLCRRTISVRKSKHSSRASRTRNRKYRASIQVGSRCAGKVKNACTHQNSFTCLRALRESILRFHGSSHSLRPVIELLYRNVPNAEVRRWQDTLKCETGAWPAL